MKFATLAACTALILGMTALSGVAADAATVSVDLGASNEAFTLYGQGETYYGSGLGTFTISQGAGVYDAIDNTSTFTLSGLITGGTSGYDSGTYEFITTYQGEDSPQGGLYAPYAQSNPYNTNQFYYDYIDPSTTITLYLDTPGGDYVEPLFADDNFVAGSGFSFAFTDAAVCTGVDSCTQNDVGVTPGATISGPVTTTASFYVPNAVSSAPEPSAWALLMLGVGGVGLALRQRRSQALAG